MKTTTFTIALLLTLFVFVLCETEDESLFSSDDYIGMWKEVDYPYTYQYIIHKDYIEHYQSRYIEFDVINEVIVNEGISFTRVDLYQLQSETHRREVDYIGRLSTIDTLIITRVYYSISKPSTGVYEYSFDRNTLVFIRQ